MCSPRAHATHRATSTGTAREPAREPPKTLAGVASAGERNRRGREREVVRECIVRRRTTSIPLTLLAKTNAPARVPQPSTSATRPHLASATASNITRRETSAVRAVRSRDRFPQPVSLARADARADSQKGFILLPLRFTIGKTALRTQFRADTVDEFAGKSRQIDRPCRILAILRAHAVSLSFSLVSLCLVSI